MNECNEISSKYLERLDPEDLKFCPIVPKTACETHCFSNLVDILLLFPFIEKVKRYVRDGINFLNYTPNTVPSNTLLILLVPFDVVNICTNITHELGIEAINSWLSKYPDLIHKIFSKEFLLESIKTILENNYFFFNKTMYTQVRGTAMRKIFAPTYATLVLAYLEEKLHSKIEIKFVKEFAIFIKENWKSFSDDCFVFWTRGKDCLKTFQLILNHLDPNLSFTMGHGEEKLPFLDILLLQNNNRILTDIYPKETDSKQYIKP